jgi:hypothetical protein
MMFKEKFQYLKDLVDKDKNPQIHNFVALIASFAMIGIAIGLSIVCAVKLKDPTTIAISALGFLSAMTVLTYNAGEKNKNKDINSDEAPKE